MNSTELQAVGETQFKPSAIKLAGEPVSHLAVSRQGVQLLRQPLVLHFVSPPGHMMQLRISLRT